MIRLMYWPKRLIFLQSWIALLWSLYYGRYGDPARNALTGDRFNPERGFVPCELCRFARILMYPIVILIIIWIWKQDDEVADYILPLAGLGIILESYQYYFQMANTADTVKSFMCGDATGVSCAATDVMYAWFITIPLLCLVAFVVIFVSALVRKYRK